MILFTNTTSNNKKIGISAIVILLLLFVGLTRYQYQQKAGTAQFSVFGGWQLAANALYGYAYAKPISPDKVSGQFKELHIIVNKHMDSLRPLRRRPDEDIGIYYLWNSKAPLKAYMAHHFSHDSTIDNFKRWSILSPLYSNYDWHIIKQTPNAFIRHYVWPNLINYYVPPTGFLGTYNQGNATVHPVISKWFNWKDNKIYTRFNDSQITITTLFTILMVIFNLLFVLGFIGMSILTGIRKSLTLYNGILCVSLFVWIANLTFSIFAAPIELRYQLFPMIITLIFGVILLVLISKNGLVITSDTLQDKTILLPETTILN